jgi:amino acid adenylation domain-containing protein
LAPDQNLIWLSAQMAGSEPAYNEPITLHYRGVLDRGAFERAFDEVVRRHEALRTTFAAVAGEVVQAVHDHLTVPVSYLDLSKLSKEGREEEANRVAEADARRPFDLGVGPLLRARLVKLEPEYHRFYLTLHHLIIDGASSHRILLPEMAAIYKAFAAGEPSPLPEPRYQYSDFSLWQKRMLDNDAAARQTAYWRKELSGELPGLQLPTDRPRPSVHSYRGAMKKFAISGEMTAALKAASRAEGATLYMFLLAGFKALLHRYSGQQDILVGGVAEARRRAEFKQTMGMFLKFVALRTHPSGDISFREYLAQVKDTVLGALANSDVPFDHLIRELHPKRQSANRPFFEATLSMKPMSIEAADPRWDLTQMDTATGSTKVDLYLEMDERPNGMMAKFIYSTDLFDASTIDRMIGHWLTLLQSAAQNPAAELCDLTILPAEEERQLRIGWNDTRREIPDATVHELIERQVQLTPNAIAVESSAERLTYAELNGRANGLAHRLRSAGVKPGALVALCVDRTADLVAAPLAVWKAGGAYLPLDPSFPKERLAYLMEDAQAPVLLTTRSLRDRLPSTNAKVVFCEEAGSGIELGTGEAGTPGSTAYVRYTSGSTGKPKGVEIHQRALVNLLRSMQREPGFTASDSLLAVTTLSFDISELELYLPLISGGRVVIAAQEDARDPRRLIERLRESKCTVLQATPAAWRGMIDAGWTGQSNLKALCGGEALPRDLAEQLRPLVAELWNVYGPTETTVWSAAHRVMSGSGPVPIGHPIDNTEIYILDSHRRLAPIGVAGELYIGGAGVANGYLRREELTRERFVPHPFQANARIYRTGDLARWKADGTLECLGRIDDQIKIRGYRIELGEVEAALLEHDALRGAAVRVWPDGSGNLSIVAYLVGSAQAEDLRRFLQKTLPDYMIPSRFVKLDALPLTPNGKVDRNALPEPASLENKAPEAEPRNETERKLAGIWNSVLNQQSIGVDDNFFDLGGHSYLVARLLRRIETEFGARLSMAAVFEAPTISQLAKLLTSQSSNARVSRTTILQPAGSQEPLFWIYGGPLFRTLASKLGTKRPFLGVNIEESERANFSNCTLSDIARRLVATIRATQPHGPYYLGGWCISGLIAYEIASQLIEAGEHVSLVVMVDAVNPVHYNTIPKYKLLASKAAHHARRVLRMEIGTAFAHARARWRRFRDRAAEPQKQRDDAFEAVLLTAAVNYQPKPIAARVLSVQPAERPQIRSLHASWAGFLDRGNFEIRDVPGDHLTMFEEPKVEGLAACIRKSLLDNIVEIRRKAAG